MGLTHARHITNLLSVQHIHMQQSSGMEVHTKQYFYWFTIQALATVQTETLQTLRTGTLKSFQSPHYTLFIQSTNFKDKFFVASSHYTFIYIPQDMIYYIYTFPPKNILYTKIPTPSLYLYLHMAVWVSTHFFKHANIYKNVRRRHLNREES